MSTVILGFVVGCGCLAAEDPQPAARGEVAAALKQLESGDREQRLAGLGLLKRPAAEEKLGAHKKAVIQRCVQLLQDKDRDVGNAASGVLSWLDADAIPPLVEALQSKDAVVQANTALVISSIASIRKPDAARTDAAIPHLAKLLHSKDKSARHNAFYAISELGPRAIPHMIDALEAEEYFQTVMMRGFVRLGRESVEPLCKALRNGSVTTRQNAAFMLFHISWQAPEVLPVLEAKALAPLTQAIQDEDQLVCSRAIDTLGRMQGRAKPALDEILVALKRPDAPFSSIAGAVRQIGPEVKDLDALFDGIERLSQTVDTTNERERAVGLFGEAIAAAGEPGLKRIMQALDDDLEMVRETAMSSLLNLGSKAAPAVPKIIERLNAGDRRAPWVLGAIGSSAKEAVSHLIRRLEHDDWLQSRRGFAIDHHSACARALAAIGESAIPALLDGLKHNNDLVRAGCVIALEEMDAKAKVPLSAIAPFCQDEHPIVRAHAMLALVRHGLPKEQLIPILTRMQKDAHPGVAGAAQHELERLTKPVVSQTP